MKIKRKVAITCWNVLVDSVPVILPLIIKHKSIIIKHAKKIKL